MDFIDPEKQHKHKVRILVGYLLVTLAILLTTVVLLFLAYGYGFGKNGQLIQSGLVFVSSSPNPAKIYLNNSLSASTTNSRLQLPAGQYTLKLDRSGYRPWIRSLGVEGGSVEHFDYPLLFPTNLVTTTVQQYTTKPGLILQSPDKRWLLIQQPGNTNSFYDYDLSNPKQLASTLTTVTLPANLVTTTSGTQSWQLVQWSADNRHILLQHMYQSGSEYILLDRQTPTASVNLTKTLNLNTTTQVSLKNNSYDQYYLFDPAAKTLTTNTLTSTPATPVLSQVLTFKAYGNNVFLYVTSNGAPNGKVDIDVLQGSTNSIIQQVPISTQYLLDVTQYSGNWFIIAGTVSGDKVYVYRNPMSQLQGQPNLPLVPVYILKVNQPNYVAFSGNAQFIMAEGGDSFAVYDAENAKGYVYDVTYPLAAGQHATWMDGDKITLVGTNNIVVFDYDDANQQTLQPALADSTAFFDASYKWSYVLAPAQPKSGQSTSQAAQFLLTSTALRLPADQ